MVNTINVITRITQAPQRISTIPPVWSIYNNLTSEWLTIETKWRDFRSSNVCKSQVSETRKYNIIKASVSATALNVQFNNGFIKRF